MFLIQQQGVLTFFGNSHPVVRPRNRCEIYNKQQALFSSLIPADKAENTPVPIIGIDPLEAIPVMIQAVKTGIFLIKVQEIPDVFLETPVAVFICQIPVKSFLFIPFVPLSEVLSHKEQFLSRMPQHEGIAGL